MQCIFKPAGTEDLPHWTPRLTLASSCICLASFQFGYHSGVINLPLKAITHSLSLDLRAQAACVSMMVVGGTIGALGCAPISDRLGRRAALVATSAPILIGTLMCAWSVDAFALAAGRFLCGIGVGAASTVAPALVAELSPPASRGLASVLTRVAMVCGILVSYITAGMLQQVSYHSLQHHHNKVHRCHIICFVFLAAVVIIIILVIVIITMIIIIAAIVIIIAMVIFIFIIAIWRSP